MKTNRKIIMITFLILVLLPVLFFASLFCVTFRHLPTAEELRNFKNAEASRVLSSEGQLLGKYYTENRTNITYKQLPDHLVNALIATEDVRFFNHEGIDSRSLVRVLFKTLLLNRSESGGGSTISQQLVKNMFGRKGRGGFSILADKYREIILARRLEKTFTKEEIITLYLNTVSFGENIFGIDAAAGRYFNRITEALRIEESAVLAGMLKATTRYNPAFYPENALSRRNVVLRQMEKYKFLNSADADSLTALPVILNYRKTESEGRADYFLVQVKKEAGEILNNIAASSGKTWDIEKDGLIITTTLSLALQNFAKQSFSDHLSVMQKHLRDQYNSPPGRKQLNELTEAILDEKHLRGRADEKHRQVIFDWKGTYSDSVSIRDSIRLALTTLHAGLLALNPGNGAVRAWVGGIDFATQPYDQILARRQLGSVFKPILYSLAFEEGIEPSRYLDNDSIVLTEYKDWSPENFDHSYGGKYSLAGALSRSMNIPTFNLFREIGFERLDYLWREMGFSFHLDNTPSLPLGTAEASIAEVAAAYSAFANGGYKVKPWSVASIIAPGGDIIYLHDPDIAFPKILGERSCRLISAILQKAVNEGTGSSMRTVYGVKSPFAGKTGTSQNYADSWFAAYNPKLTVIVRAGASSPAIHFNSPSFGTGSALALPLAAMTLRKTESYPETAGEFITSFPVLPPELEEALDCPDFKEDNFMDKLLDIIKKNEPDYFNRSRKKRPFFERLFRRK
jgi:penicillin-binding protein 1A